MTTAVLLAAVVKYGGIVAYDVVATQPPEQWCLQRQRQNNNKMKITSNMREDNLKYTYNITYLIFYLFYYLFI